jgi:hypothetical protein
MTKYQDNHGDGQDYSGITLDQMWESVSQPDNRTWPQIAAWDTMAQVCAEQAEQLHRALIALMRTWPPLPGSAAEAFANEVQTLIGSMRRDSADATIIQPVLVDISSELEAAKLRIQALIDQQNHFLTVERARSKLGTPEFNTMDAPSRDLATQPLPNGWRQDLHDQGTAVMQIADSNLAVITTRMPVLGGLQSKIDQAAGGGEGSHTGGGGTGNVQGVQIPTIGSVVRALPDDLNLRPTPVPSPVLAGGPQASAGSSDPLPVTLFGGSTSPSPDGSGTSSTRVVVPVDPVGRVIGLPNTSMGLTPGNSATAEALDTNVGADRTVNSRSATPSAMMTPPAGRGGQTVTRSAVRPGGRAALWASQRRKKRADPADPWSVPEGVPPVIESVDPVEHDPGPGVIGLDR